MRDANRSIKLIVPESVEVSRWPEIRRLLTGTLHDETLHVEIAYQPAESPPTRHVLGKTVGVFTLDEIEAVAAALFKFLSQQFRILLDELAGPLRWEEGLQLA
jgi:hypothetical protein